MFSENLDAFPRMTMCFRESRCVSENRDVFRESRCVFENRDVFPKMSLFSENLVHLCFRKSRCFPRIPARCARCFPEAKSLETSRFELGKKITLTASQETSNVVFFFCYNYGWSLVRSSESRSQSNLLLRLDARWATFRLNHCHVTKNQLIRAHVRFN